CIEVLSDSSLGEIERDIDDKFGEYEYAGVREYYILDNRRGRHMSFYELDPATGRYVPMDVGPDGIVRSTVLTGFQFRIEDLYRQPSLLQMVNDPVYQHFVMTEYQRERRRAQQEAQRAEAERRAREAADRRAAQEAQRAQQEAQRAEQEAQRAEQEAHKSMKYAELLRSMGIDPDAIE
ncbi:MAG: Uma2 family endonuclease, partial [Chloroflexota bacterium]